MDTSKYSIGYYPAPGEHYKWVHKDHIEHAPAWCSVDLRDGNQSLVIPMSLTEKLGAGFPEIHRGDQADRRGGGKAGQAAGRGVRGEFPL